MRNTRLMTSLLLLALVPCARGGNGDPTVIRVHAGIAHDTGGRVLYREMHYLAGDSRLVLYRCPDGRAFARKRIEGAGAAPDFDFADGRDGYREGVRGVAGGREVFWRAGHGKPGRQVAVAKTGATVFDAGFDAFVRQNWTALERGQAMRARFLVPSRLGSIGLRVQRRAGAPAGFLDLGMRLDAWYGFAVPEFRLRYRKADRWLTRFEGIGTIRNTAGAYPKLRIDFPEAPASASPAELQAARDTALVSACGGGM